MRKQVQNLMVRVENLNQILILVTRYGEDDLQRMVRYKIEGLERELKILRNTLS